MTIKHTAGGTRYEQHGEPRERKESVTWEQLQHMADEEMLDGEWSAETANERCTRYGELLRTLAIERR